MVEVLDRVKVPRRNTSGFHWYVTVTVTVRSSERVAFCTLEPSGVVPKVTVPLLVALNGLFLATEFA